VIVMILCSPQSWSIIKAALLAKIHQDLPCVKGEEPSLGLFGYSPDFDADTFTLPHLVQLAAKKNIEAKWLLAAPGKTLASYINANLRYTACGKVQLAFAVIEESLNGGYSYTLHGLSDISRVFLNRYRAVWHEVHRMTGFIRFHPTPDGELAAQPKLFHHTADLILRQFSPRYPGTTLVLVLDNHALMLKNGKLSTAPMEKYLASIENDSFTPVWEKYYQSQYIASRKNIALAERVIPKKYWNWLEEGRLLEEAAKK